MFFFQILGHLHFVSDREFEKLRKYSSNVKDIYFPKHQQNKKNEKDFQVPFIQRFACSLAHKVNDKQEHPRNIPIG